MEKSPGTNLISPQEIMQENLVFLREYARLLLIEEDETLTPVEDFKDVLMQEILAMGTYLKLTERDMMLLIFKFIGLRWHNTRRTRSSLASRYNCTCWMSPGNALGS